jgi:nucleotide-binding universal stress UspA family protein
MAKIGDGTKVLVGVDGSKQNRAAVAWALYEARARDSEVIAAYAWHLPTLVYYAPGYLPMAADEMVDEGTRVLQAAVGDVPGHEDVKVEMRVLQGGARSALARIAEEPGVGIVVVGSRGHSAIAGSLLGSVSHALSHHCAKPLVIVPSPRHDSGVPASIRRIVVGVDGSAAADSALHWAAEEAAIHEALLEVVTAWSWATAPADMLAGVPAGESLEYVARDLLRKSVQQITPPGGGVNTTAREGYAPNVLLDMAEDADLLVVGSRGRGMAAEFILGSTSHQCVHRSPIPVVIVPSPENSHA